MAMMKSEDDQEEGSMSLGIRAGGRAYYKVWVARRAVQRWDWAIGDALVARQRRLGQETAREEGWRPTTFIRVTAVVTRAANGAIRASKVGTKRRWGPDSLSWRRRGGSLLVADCVPG
jgi:hypothetical protein